MSSEETRNAGLQALEREMRRLGLELELHSQSAAAELGLNAVDLSVLALLQEGGARTAGQLGDATFLTTGAVTGMIDRLERAGYVRRGRDPQDRRRVVVELVSERADRLDLAFEPLQRVASELTEDWSPRELERVAAFVGEVARRLHDETGRRRAGTPAPEPPAESGDFSAPLGGLERARLELVGAAYLSLVVDPGMEELYRARFDGRLPRVKAEGGVVTVSYSRFRLFDFRQTSGRIALNPSVSWEIEARGLGAKLDADLSGLPLRSLQVTHGASDVHIVLPRPQGHVRVSVAGGASAVTLQRPKGVPVRLHMTGGASSVTLDAQTVATVGGETQLESPGFARAGDRYEIELSGGASAISVVEIG
jgi:DNA-binding MarR family transcriptional regulator